MEFNVKKIEIITDFSYLRLLTRLLDDHNVPGYTIIKDVMGKDCFLNHYKGIKRFYNETDTIPNLKKISKKPCEN